MKAFRRVACLVVLAAIALVAPARQAAAAPEVHRLNLVLSSNPTQLVAKDVNDFLDDYNRIVLRSRGLEDVLFLVGGVIPPRDVPALLDGGADGVFVAGTPLETVVRFIRERVSETEARA